MTNDVDVVVIGAGQAGLSAVHHLRRAGFEPGTGYVAFDHNPAPGGAWLHRWDSLTVATVNGIFDLPGMPLGFDTLDPKAKANEVVPAYFAEYERRFDLRVQRPVNVKSVHETVGGRLLVDTDKGSWSARAIINATGTWEKPFWPHYPGMASFKGRHIHTAGFHSAEEFAGKRVVVVGAGSSALGHLMEIAEVAAETTWVTRRPPEFTEEPWTEQYGREVVARVDARVRAGLPPESVIRATGYPVTPAIRAGLESGVLDREPMFDRVTPEGVAWDDGGFVAADVIVWATGFRASLDHLAPLRLREPGGGIRMDGTRVAADPRVHLVGYGPSASTVGANRAGREAVREIRRMLGAEALAA
ncbi:NAD(P)-binding domain-containing protein [Phytomonospora sp. NPDC050363]|uniref:NAD(P)-binding domain-containing protein n=1 Tax=Phytomonospora sp. NPDC050363 TaxID=3155642 RepID=UPI0034114CAE